MTASAVSLDLGGLVEGAGNMLMMASEEALSLMDPVEIANKVVQAIQVVEKIAAFAWEALKKLKSFIPGQEDKYPEFRTKSIEVVLSCKHFISLLDSILKAFRASLSTQNPTLLATYLEHLSSISQRKDTLNSGSLDIVSRYREGNNPLVMQNEIADIESKDDDKTIKTITIADFVYELVWGVPTKDRSDSLLNPDYLRIGLLVTMMERLTNDLQSISSSICALHRYTSGNSNSCHDLSRRYTDANLRYKFIYLYNCMVYLVEDFSAWCNDSEDSNDETMKDLRKLIKENEFLLMTKKQQAASRFLEMKANFQRYKLLSLLYDERMKKYDKQIHDAFPEKDSGRAEAKKNVKDRNEMYSRKRLELEALLFDLGVEIQELASIFGIEENDARPSKFFRTLEESGISEPEYVFNDHLLAALALGSFHDAYMWAELKKNKRKQLPPVHEDLARLSYFVDEMVFQSPSRREYFLQFAWDGSKLKGRIPVDLISRKVPAERWRRTNLASQIKNVLHNKSHEIKELTVIAVKAVFKVFTNVHKGLKHIVHADKNSLDKLRETLKLAEKNRLKALKVERKGGLFHIRTQLDILVAFQYVRKDELDVKRALDIIEELDESMKSAIPRMMVLAQNFASYSGPTNPSPKLFEALEIFKIQSDNIQKQIPKEMERIRKLENGGGGVFGLGEGSHRLTLLIDRIPKENKNDQDESEDSVESNGDDNGRG